MRIGELFQGNPFQNLIIAVQDSVNFKLRGHEEQFEDTMREISSAVQHADYRPEELQHTIVFGEWGHGKTHLLRSLENKINTTAKDKARAVYYEPTFVDPNKVLIEISRKLELEVSNISEFITGIEKGRFPPHLFLLIDESQSLVGEDVHGNYESDLNTYYKFLEELVSATETHHLNLHIFHGFSANTARAIEKMGQLPLIRKLARGNVFTLNSLAEEDQWQMILDHIRFTIKPDAGIPTESLIDRGVSICINKLTGGNPRWALMLMNEVFNRAQDRKKIDYQVCYEALRETSRIDDPSQKYFDSFIIDDVLDRLRNGQINEQKIADLFATKQAKILGGWCSVDQEGIDEFGLTARNAKRHCPSLQEIQVFEQNLDGDFEITEDFRKLIQVTSPRTIINPSERELLFRLSLEPETLLRKITDGLQTVLTFAHYPSVKEMQVGHKKIDVLYLTANPFSDQVAGVGIGLIIYKGQEIPFEVFEQMSHRILQNKCSVAFFIEDAMVNHADPQSSYRKFLDAYDGPLDLSRRFFFIDETGGFGSQFDEDFFVSIINSARYEPEKSIEIFRRLGLEQRLRNISENSIYCPTEQERTLIRHFLLNDDELKIGEIRSLKDNFFWVNKERMNRLSDYIEKRGARYGGIAVAEIDPFRYLLKNLKSTEQALSLEELDEKYRQEWILTGTEESIKYYLPWAIEILEKKGLVEKKNGTIHFKDIEQEIDELKASCEELFLKNEEFMKMYEQADFLAHWTRHLEQRLDETRESFENCEPEPRRRRDCLTRCQYELSETLRELEKIPDEVREELRNENEATIEDFDTLKREATWPFAELPDPYEPYLEDANKELNAIKDLIEKEIPSAGGIREKIKGLRTRISILM
ncbi:MAG: hypothetical protein ACFE7E_06730, partial [Candidatus Hodarchaeota archaeon]